MKDADKNRDQGRAVKRATADLRCAVRKLLTVHTMAEIVELVRAADTPRKAKP